MVVQIQLQMLLVGSPSDKSDMLYVRQLYYMLGVAVWCAEHQAHLSILER